MNRAHRLIRSGITGAWVAVAECVRARGKRGGAVVGTLAASLALAGPPAPNALPTGGVVVTGAASIASGGARMDITQTSQRAVINWSTFDIGAQAHVHFSQPSAAAVALNRVAAGNPSSIYGKLTADGQVFLVNPSGVLFGPNASVDVAGLVASTLDIADADFMAGNHRFDRGGAPGTIRNQGKLTAAEGGYIALLAPEVRNEGTVVARLGTVAFAAGDAVTLDFTGNKLVQIKVDPATIRALIENKHIVSAPGGLVILSARAADRLIGASINNGGIVEADTLQNVNGKIVLDTTGSVTNTGVLTASGKASGETGGRIEIAAAWVGLGGTVKADGATGGAVEVKADSLSLAEHVSARGTEGMGGSIRYAVAGDVIESSTGVSDASGATDGGMIELKAGGAVFSSGSYDAGGATGSGGRIDLTGDTLRLFSATLKATGATQGGLVRVGGGFQGGKTPDLPDDEEGTKLWAFVGRWPDPPPLATARVVFVNDSTRFDVSAKVGPGGTAVVWSDQQTTMLGKVDATGATTGGAVEISSAENLKKADLLNITIGPGGFLLLDPKNITVGDTATVSSWAYQAILGKGYAPEKNTDTPFVTSGAYFGYAVALNGAGDRLAVGAWGDAGGDGILAASGAVRLFSFTDTNFSGGVLEATVGKGYTGGKNIDVAALETGDRFGMSVALNAAGDRLAAGAYLDDGANNAATDSGAVRLFSFTDTNFSGGVLEATLGKGYSGGKNVDVSSVAAYDNFGRAVALNAAGDRLAVGALADDGAGNATANSGAVYLFGFSDTSFSNGTLAATVGKGYTGDKNVDVSALGAYDYFGMAVALNAAGDRLAVSAYADDGADNAVTDSGAVYLFDFTDTVFSGGSLQATLGRGYTGGKNIDMAALETLDYFGQSVALNAAGDRLAVGAFGDDGANNAVASSGAVYLFDFTGTAFSGGSLQATVGRGYTGGKNVDVGGLSGGKSFGTGVALNAAGDRLAVGAYQDAGKTNGEPSSGAVYLFSFADANFNGGAHQAIIGSGYAPVSGTSFDVPALEAGDNAGRSVALNAAGDRMAVGAHLDDGFGNTATNSGAVHLFSFTDASFAGGRLEGTVGRGYTGGKNVDVATLEANDYFGQSVALNADATRLAVAAYGDDGYGNTKTGAGAAYLFSFADTAFAGGNLEAVIGKGYAPAATGRAKDIDLPLDTYDQVLSVALNAAGDRLAVGAYADNGYNNAVSDPGAVYLFSFTDTSFSGGSLQATVGKGYTGGKNVDVPGLTASDYFGYSVALNAAGDRLAVGAIGDDGADNTHSAAGAVYLFSFTDTHFSGGSLQATLGRGYTGGKNIDMTAVEATDWFGAAVALNGAGNRLAVGALYDDGAGNATLDSGAVRLFSFTDTGGSFGGGALEATLGKGYSGGKNVDVAALTAGDYFGYAVALNAAGDRLAVGAFGDDGYGDASSNPGAVYLFGFTDTAFSGGNLLGVAGRGYRNEAKDIDVPGLSGVDTLGQALALNAAGDRLAVGAIYDDGADGATSNAGAVLLYSFADANWSGGSLQATVGKGYAGGKNVNVADLDAGDYFGRALAFNAAGDRLAVGADYGDGANNTASSSGEVRLFSFSDANFSNGTLQATVGKGYTGGKNVDVGALAAGDYFGHSVALNAAGDRLAVGAYLDDGYNNAVTDSGAVYLFGFTDIHFSGGSLQATVGKGYTVGKNIDVAALETSDWFGQSVALNAAGNRLAVGANGDDGSGNPAGVSNSGAVRLFGFTDTNFTGGTLEATLGKGYSGSKDFDPGINHDDNFGTAVALNAAGDRLAVGVYKSDLGGTDYGAVYLMSFTDTSFGGGSLAGRIGRTASGGKSVDLTALATSDQFGYSVAMNAAGDRLAVGAIGDDGYGESAVGTGAVYLLSFTDGDFSGGGLQGIMGKGYTGGKSVNVALDPGDGLGSAVALNAAGNRLALGAPNDGGAGNATEYSGAVRLFGFADSSFSGGNLLGTVGKGYSGGKNVDVTALEAYDFFGSAVAMNADGTRLAVGAPGDDGSAGANSGAAYLFSFADASFGGGNLEGSVAGSAANDKFGAALALNANAQRMAVGAPGKDGNRGAVSLFGFGDKFANRTLLNTLDGANVAALEAGDQFGAAVALNAASNRLAVGAYQDDGAGNAAADSGAVYLFGFADTAFSAPTLEGTLGKGYTGGKSVDVAAIEAGDQFGRSVALNAAGDRLAVGAIGDGGSGNLASYSGAVHLFGFTNTSFGGGSLYGSIGRNYAGGKNVDVAALEANDYFGTAVALNAAGDRLAVGAPGDDGSGNGGLDAGAAWLFGFLDGHFKGGTLQAPLGYGYTGGKNVDISVLQNTGYFGRSVALNADATRLAVGAPNDDGADLGTLNSGAVRLFSFGDTHWSGGKLEATLGKGYTGGKNVDVSALAASDNFGYSVALNAAGDRLAVGANGDDGFADAKTNTGAAYLFSFSDAGGAFGGGTHEGTLGVGYAGAKDINLTATLGGANAGTWKNFGYSVALNAAGDRLAVGASGEDGGGATLVADSGAVYLFSFANGDWGGGVHAATIGKNYTGGKNVDVAGLNGYDNFGWSVALNAAGDRLAVGAARDNGYNNVSTDSGAVRLFSFTDASFAGGVQEAILGKGYTGGKNVDVSALETSDNFGSAVALNGAGNLLAVGAYADDGAGNAFGDAGAVRLFGFSDTGFTDGALQAAFGKGYTGGKNVDVSALAAGDAFGRSVALNAAGDRMAVGANGDDGYNNLAGESGAVYLFSATVETQPAAISDAAFATQGGADVSVSALAVAQQLSAGTAVTLQANNDITVSAAITANNTAGNGGAFTLQAGRSVYLNANIATDNGDFTAIANERTANGVIDAFRLPGAATIAQAAGTTVNAGSGTASFIIRDGAGKTNTASGHISLANVTAGTITAVNEGPTSGSGIAVSGSLTSSATGDSLVLAGDRLVAGSSAAFSSAGRWLVYLDEAPTASTFAGSIDSANHAVWNTSYTATPPASLSAAGNRYVFAWKPTITVASTSLSKIYGKDLTSEIQTAYTISGVQTGVAGAFLGDDPASVYSGTPLVGSAGAPASAAAGSYSVDVAAGTFRLLRGDYGLALASTGRLAVASPPFVPVTEVKIAVESKDAKESLKLPGDSGARLSQLVAADAERHQARAELYNDGLNVLKKNPRAADIPECTAGGSEVCIPRPAAAVNTNAADAAGARSPLLPPTEIGKRVAVLIGNSDYQGEIPPLETPTRDVEALGHLLKTRMGFEVHTLKNATKADIVKTLKRLAETTSRDESVMVMYAGHGFQPEKGGEGYWMPVDASHDNPERWISNRDIARILGAIPAKQVMLVSDSCFAGGLTAGGQQTAKTSAPREDILSRRAVMVMTSGGEEPVSDAGKGDHSVFMHHLLDTLQNTSRPTTLTQVFGLVKQAVIQEFPQEPHLGTVKVAGHMPGGDYLIDVR